MKSIIRNVRDVQQHWVGNGFPVQNLFSYHTDKEFDPFLLLDYAGPHPFPPDKVKRGVGEHPHRGFETVTIVYQGEVEHRDSNGNHGTIGPGDVQWMTAASGIVHEEFHSERFREDGGTLEMVQLWVNLPAHDKMTEPRYQEIPNTQIPQVLIPDGAGLIRVIAGEYLGTHGPAKTFTEINVWDLQLNKGGEINLKIPVGHTSLLIVQKGTISVNGNAISAVELALFEKDGSYINLKADNFARILILTGEPLNESLSGQGPFVMNTLGQIRQAFEDYQNGKMGHLS